MTGHDRTLCARWNPTVLSWRPKERRTAALEGIRLSRLDSLFRQIPSVAFCVGRTAIADDSKHAAHRRSEGRWSQAESRECLSATHIRSKQRKLPVDPDGSVKKRERLTIAPTVTGGRRRPTNGRSADLIARLAADRTASKMALTI
jgi:hypothetical protein